MSKLIDLTGQRFGRWTVIERDYENVKKNIHWKCRCDCGTFRSVSGTSLRSGISVSCGCEKDEKTSIRMKKNTIDLSGQRFGMWTVISQDTTPNEKAYNGSRWICRCDCGREKSVTGYSLRFGRSTCCGCKCGESKIIDLTGEKYGKLTVLKQDDKNIKTGRGIRWICKCDCGNTVSVFSSRLRSGVTRSCGCLAHDSKRIQKNDLNGQKIGRWTVLRRDDEKRNRRETFYICQCECGNIRSVSGDSLRRGTSKSCGCSKIIPNNDLTGRKFGMLTVLKHDVDNHNDGAYWICRCDCGRIKSIKGSNMYRGAVRSCGCENRRLTSEREFKDISGQRIGKLTVVSVDHKSVDKSGGSRIFWKCLCDCGNETVVVSSSLINGDTKSCGCYQSEQSAKRAKDRTIDLVGKRFGFLTVEERVSSSDDGNISTWKCKCDCGNYKLADGYYLRIGSIASCGCLKQSKNELFVLRYFNECGYIGSIDYDYQKRFDDLRGWGERKLSYDFAVYSNGNLIALIECQGQQHYKPVDYFGGEEQFAKQQLHDELKRDYAASLGVPLIEIPYTAVSYEEVKSILLAENIN